MSTMIAKKRVAVILGVSTHTVDRYARFPDFPRGRRLSRRTIRYVEIEILEWLNRQ